MTPLLSIRGLKKRFDERLILDIPELVLMPASAYLLTGVNGSGKTTLLRILSGLERAEITEATYLSQPVKLSPYPKLLRNAIVYVHQQPILFSTSLEKNIGYGLQLRGMDKAAIQKEVGDAMAWAGVSHLRNHDPATLSGGEKQRVALARAKVLKPKLLLLDEPTANLDEAAKAQVAALIPSLVQEGGSILIVSHDHQLIDIPHINWMALKDGKISFPN